eukprot:5631333-Prymnesium_polylepis.1
MRACMRTRPEGKPHSCPRRRRYRSCVRGAYDPLYTGCACGGRLASPRRPPGARLAVWGAGRSTGREEVTLLWAAFAQCAVCRCARRLRRARGTVCVTSPARQTEDVRPGTRRRERAGGRRVCVSGCITIGGVVLSDGNPREITGV